MKNRNRLDLLYPQRPTKKNWDPKSITLKNLEEQGTNFFVIGTDAKNPWGAQSHKLRPIDVLNLTRSRINIRATPHIGLHWPSNSMYPHMGVTICDYMGNTAYIDTADEPHNVKEGGAIHNCALQTGPVLSPYLRLNPNSIQSNGYIAAKNFAGKTNLGHVHHEAKRLALGSENVMLDADLLQVPFVFDFFQILVENQDYILQGYDSRLGIFDRHVSLDGKIERSQPGLVSDIDAFLQMKQQHATMIREDCILPATGFFPIKESVILLDSLVCYWEQIQHSLEHEEVGDTYTMSGIDMIKYTKSQPLRDVLDRMYKCLLLSGKFQWLPKYLAHTILPGGTFRFLPCNAEQDLLENVLTLIELHKQRVEINYGLSTVLAGLTEKSSQLEIDDAMNERARLLIWSKEIINPGLVVERKKFKDLVPQRRGFSQFDLLNGDHVPQEVIDSLMGLTFEQIQNLFRFDAKIIED